MQILIFITKLFLQQYITIKFPCCSIINSIALSTYFFLISINFKYPIVKDDFYFMNSPYANVNP